MTKATVTHQRSSTVIIIITNIRAKIFADRRTQQRYQKRHENAASAKISYSYLNEKLFEIKLFQIKRLNLIENHQRFETQPNQDTTQPNCLKSLELGKIKLAGSNRSKKNFSFDH